jgi:hypothetical protein
MKITEIVNGVHCYVATVRIKRGKSTTKSKTIIYAENTTQARNLLSAMYGDDSVILVRKVSESDLNETVLNRAKSNLESQVLPTEYIHDLAQKRLLNQMKRNARHVDPTIDDLRAAQDKFEGEQKRIDRAYDEALKDREKWAAIRKRNCRKQVNN